LFLKVRSEIIWALSLLIWAEISGEDFFGDAHFTYGTATQCTNLSNL